MLHPLLMALLAFWLLPVDPFWAKIAVVCAALPLGATAFVLAQRYQLLEAETSTGAVISTAGLRADRVAGDGVLRPERAPTKTRGS